MRVRTSSNKTNSLSLVYQSLIYPLPLSHNMNTYCSLFWLISTFTVLLPQKLTKAPNVASFAGSNKCTLSYTTLLTHLALLGGSYCSTQFTSGISMPLAMTSVHTKIPLWHTQKNVTEVMEFQWRGTISLLPLLTDTTFSGLESLQRSCCVYFSSCRGCSGRWPSWRESPELDRSTPHRHTCWAREQQQSS